MKPHLTPAQLEAFGEEGGALRRRAPADLGGDDAAYIRTVVKRQQQIYAHLNEWIASGAIHAVTMKFFSQAAWAERS